VVAGTQFEQRKARAYLFEDISPEGELPPRLPRILEAAGWTRRQTQEFLWRHCQRTVADARAKGFETSPFVRPDQKDDDFIRLVTQPEKFHIVFAGGAGGVSISVSSIASTRPVGAGA
jgi:hypothetical protein